MMIFTLLALLLITNDAAVGDETVQSVEAWFGKDVRLPCTCPAETKNLSWQRGEQLVNAHPLDENLKIHEAYVSRTELTMEKENCSLLLRNVHFEDAGVYTCYAVNEVVTDVVWTFKTLNVNLTVSEKKSSNDKMEGELGESNKVVSIGVPILVSILTVVLLTTLLIRRRHWKSKDTDIPAQQPMMIV